MQLVTPSVVAMAVRMEMVICITVFHVSRLILIVLSFLFILKLKAHAHDRKVNFRICSDHNPTRQAVHVPFNPYKFRMIKKDESQNS